MGTEKVEEMPGEHRTAPEPRRLEYQVGTPAVTRGQFRIVWILLLMQVVMTAQSTYAPGMADWARQKWAAHREAVARREETKQNAARLRAAMGHLDPPGKVVWEEDPAAASALLAGGGYQAIIPSGERGVIAGHFPPGAAANPFTAQLAVVPNFWTGGMYRAVVFTHARSTPGGKERLVVAVVAGELRTSSVGGSHSATESFNGSVYKYQQFGAGSFGVEGADGNPVDDAPVARLKLQAAGDEYTEMKGAWQAAASPDSPGTLTIQYRKQLRVFAGQPDPADASHFTFDYVLDGTPGTIDGWLKPDNSVRLVPRAGKVVNELWYPLAK